MDMEKIYEAYFADVYFYVRRLSGSEQIAEEITSETFFRALRSAAGFRGACDIRVWLCQIAKNCYFSYCKKAGRTVSLDAAALEAVADPAAPPDEAICRKLEAERLRRRVHALPDPYREVLMWRMFAELSFRQIGAIFHRSGNWACVTCHRAIRMLKNGLEGECHET